MLKKMRWLVPVGLIWSAGTMASAEVRLVFGNDSNRPWRLRCLQDTPEFNVRHIRAGGAELATDKRSYRVEQEILVPGKSRVELQLADHHAPNQTLRFALLHEGMAEPGGTVLAFTWNWKDVGKGTAELVHAEGTDPQRLKAVWARGNESGVYWDSFTPPAAGAGAGSGSGALDPKTSRLPRGGAGKEAVEFEFLPLAAVAGDGADAGAGSGSGSGLPTGPSMNHPQTRMAYEADLRARAAAAAQAERKAERKAEPKTESKVEGKAGPKAESKAEPKAAGEGPLRVIRESVRNHSGIPFQVTVDGVAVPVSPTAVPAGAETRLQLVGDRSPFRPTLRLTEAVTPERAAEFVYRPLGATPDQEGKAPADLCRVDEGKGMPGAIVRKGEAGALVIEPFDAEAEAGLTAMFARLAMAGLDGAPRRLAAAGAGAGVGGLVPTAGSAGMGLLDQDPVSEEDIADFLDLDAVAAGGEQAEDAVMRFLENRLDRHPNFSKRLSQLVEQIKWTLTAAGFPGKAVESLGKLSKQPAIQRLDRQYKDAGQPLLNELMRREAEQRQLGLVPGKPETLRTNLNAAWEHWLVGSLRWALDDFLAQATRPAASSSGAGSSSQAS